MNCTGYLIPHFLYLQHLILNLIECIRNLISNCLAIYIVAICSIYINTAISYLMQCFLILLYYLILSLQDCVTILDHIVSCLIWLIYNINIYFRFSWASQAFISMILGIIWNSCLYLFCEYFFGFFMDCAEMQADG